MSAAPRIARALTLAAALCAACDRFPTDPGEALTAPDPLRGGAGGADGPRGAAFVDVTAQARVTEQLALQVVFPARLDSTLDLDGAPYPAVVFLQGAAITRSRYHWLAAHMATRGYVVILPDHPFNLPMLDTDRAILALRTVRDAASHAGTLQRAIDPSAPAVVMGHSLGGLVAARQWVAYTDFIGLAMLASSTAEGDDVALRAGSPVLLVAGSADVPTGITRVQQAYQQFRAPRLYAQVEGLNHYAWTDDPASDELTSDGPRRAAELPAIRRAALTIVDLWLDSVLRHDTEAAERLQTAEFSGVTFLR